MEELWELWYSGESVRVVELLQTMTVEEVAASHAPTLEGYTVLHAAAHAGRTEEAAALLAMPGMLQAAMDSGCYATPLHLAVGGGEGQSEVLRMLVDAAEREHFLARNSAGETPLLLATRAAIPGQVALLAAASPLAARLSPADDGCTALQLSCRQRNDRGTVLCKGVPAEELAKQRANGRTALHEAAAADSPAHCKALLHCGAECALGLQDDDGNTPLHLAARTMSGVELVRLFLPGMSREEVALRNAKGLTARKCAATRDISAAFQMPAKAAIL